jgi:hypothetical protein
VRWEAEGSQDGMAFRDSLVLLAHREREVNLERWVFLEGQAREDI